MLMSMTKLPISGVSFLVCGLARVFHHPVQRYELRYRYVSHSFFLRSMLHFVAAPCSPPCLAVGGGLRLCQVFGETVHGFDPALLSPIAIRARGDASVPEGDLSLLACMLLERHRQQRFQWPVRAHSVMRRRDNVAFGIREGIGEDDPLGHHDFTKYALAPDLASLGRSHAVVHDATRAKIDGAERRGVAHRTPPAHEVLRLRPCLEHELARSVEHARDDKLLLRWLRVGITIVRHLCSLPSVARADTRPGDRSSAPRSGDIAPPNRRSPSADPPPTGRAATAPRGRARSGRHAPAP